MNGLEMKEFQEWYAMMKERVAQILGDPVLTEEQKQVFMEIHWTAWYVEVVKAEDGYGINESNDSPSNEKRLTAILSLE